MRIREAARELRKRRYEPVALLTAEQRVKAVLKIVGEERRDRVERVVLLLIGTQERWRGEREHKRKLRNRRFAKQFNTRLRRITDLTRNAPPEWWTYAGIDRDQLLHHFKMLHTVSATIEATGADPPAPSAEPKKLAALTALTVCNGCGIEPRMTEGGKYFRIAAALYGDPEANLDHHCRWARKRAQMTAKPRPK
jgi:hypothetical protein